MQFTILMLLALIIAGCAHQQTTPTSNEQQSPANASGATSESQEDALIKHLPRGEGDLGSGQTIDVPVEINEPVQKWIVYFQGRGRDYFERYLQRSALYMPMMRKVLAKNGMPEDLVYLALIESGFSGKIKSRAGAVGFWQFMPSTGKHYGLKRTRWIDERSDPVRSTEAAAAYLKGLYNLFGNWYLAIASYNVGENRIKNLVMKNYTRNFWELARRKALPVETQQYIPKFIAAGLIAREPEKYGFIGIQYNDDAKFENITLTDAVDLRKWSDAMNMDYQLLTALNPQFRTQFAPGSPNEPLIVRIPENKLQAAQTTLAVAIVKNKHFVADNAEPAGYRRHRVRRGETLQVIAEKYDLSEEDIVRVNRIRGNKRLRPGMSLKIPAYKSSQVTKPQSSRAKAVASQRHISSVMPKMHVVRRGETLIKIARKYRITVKALAKRNKLTARARVQTGQRLNLPRS